MGQELEHMTAEELRGVLRDRDLPVSGNKAELVARIHEDNLKRRDLSPEADDLVPPIEQVAQADPAERVDVTVPEDEGDGAEDGDGPSEDSTVEELKEELRERDLPVSGNKAELLDRLDARAPEVMVADQLAAADRELRAEDPTVSALYQVECAAIEAAENPEDVELDESVAAMLEMQARSDRPETHEEALEKAEELGGRADVQQVLMQSDANAEQPLAQRPVELVDPLADGAAAGTFKDSTQGGQVPGTVVREQRRPGAPLTEEQSDVATFPSGPKDRDVDPDDEPFVADEGEGPVVAREDREEVEA